MMARQMNLQITPEFERDLDAIVRAKGSSSRSEAVRQLVHEAADHARKRRERLRDQLDAFRGVAAEGALPAFEDDELWEDE